MEVKIDGNTTTLVAYKDNLMGQDYSMTQEFLPGYGVGYLLVNYTSPQGIIQVCVRIKDVK